MNGDAVVLRDSSGTKGILACCGKPVTKELYWLDLTTKLWSKLSGFELPTPMQGKFLQRRAQKGTSIRTLFRFHFSWWIDLPVFQCGQGVQAWLRGPGLRGAASGVRLQWYRDDNWMARGRHLDQDHCLNQSCHRNRFDHLKEHIVCWQWGKDSVYIILNEQFQLK